jgi:Uma2 family endonuclease
MNILHQPLNVPGPRQRFVLYGVGWRTYEKLVGLFQEQHLQMNYDRGTLELMSPYPPHEVYKTLFGYFVSTLADEFAIPFKCLGSTTLRRENVQRGLEPDQCYYLTSAGKVRNWWTLDLSVDPPPDLAIEIDISPPELDRMSIYAGLGVPEVWRFDGEALHVCRLGEDGKYSEVPQSVHFPFLPIAEVLPVLIRAGDTTDDRQILRILREWVRDRVKPLWEAAGRPGSAPQ